MNKPVRIITVIALALAASVQAQNMKVHDVFAPLPAGSIHFTNYFENDIQNSINNWSKGVVPYKKLVEFYRTGRPQFALGEMWGKAVRSGSMFYRYSRDAQLKEILHNTVKDLLTTVRSNGSISCAPVDKQPDGNGGDLWERKYVLLALSQYYNQVEADPAVLEAMKREALSIIDQVGEPPKVDINSLGWSVNHIESSSTLEPIMRLYKLTGDQRFLNFATYIITHGGCQGYNIFQQAYDNVAPCLMAGIYPKAYEMTSIFEGLAEYYRATGDKKWKTTLLNYFNNVRNQEITIIGNGGGDQPHGIQPHQQVWAGEAWDSTKFEQTNPKVQRMMETCTGVTWMKFCSQILRLTGDPQTVDEIEKYVYNGLLGAMKPTGDGFSYVNLLNGEKVTNKGWGWKFDGLPVTCCNLNGPMGLAYIPYIAIMQAKDGPVINLYNAATATAATAKGHPVKLTINTIFPKDNNVKIKVETSQKEKFNLRLRIPEWSESTVVKVNGKTIANVHPGTYLNIKRKWNKKDLVEIALDMRCRLIDAPRGNNPEGYNFQAVKYGPIVLARDENTDVNYNQPVQVVADSNHEVTVARTQPTLESTRMEFIVPTTAGSIHMVDYSSVNCWNGKKICTWLPMLSK
jgi:DUF1680 family protein